MPLNGDPDGSADWTITEESSAPVLQTICVIAGEKFRSLIKLSVVEVRPLQEV